jgi:hypothetical protein
MTNIDDYLNEIEDDFDFEIKRKTNEFSLTNAFNNNGYLSKIIKGLLLFSISAGAFANINNAGSGLDTLIKQYNQPQTKIEMMLLQKEQKLDSSIIKKNNFFSGIELNVLTPDIIDDSIKEGVSGVYRMPNSNDPIILYQDGKLSSENLSEDVQLELKRVKKYLNNFNIKNDSPVARAFSDSTLKTINLIDQHFSNVESPFINEQKTPLLKKYENEFQALHEFAHAQKYQQDFGETIRNGIQRNFNGYLMKEVSSDLYGVLGVAKKHDLSVSETQQMLEEVANVRESLLFENLDIGHSTTPAIKAFIKNFNDNPNLLKTIKESDDELLLSLTAKYGFEFHNQLDLGKGVPRLKFHHMEKDIQMFKNNNDSFKLEDTYAYKKLSGSHLNVEKILERVDYKGYLKRMSIESEKHDFSLRRLVRSDDTSKGHFRGLNQINLLYKYENILMNQNELNKITMNHLSIMNEQNEIKKLQLDINENPHIKTAQNKNINKFKIKD